MKTDICIIGGGIMGLATAFHICKTSDSQVQVLDKYGIGNEYCSSNDVNRVFRFSYGNDELYTRMAVESLRLWRFLEKESGQDLLSQTGLLLLNGHDENSNRFNEASYQTLSRMNLPADRLDNDELNRRFPLFKADQAFFDPNGGVILASKALQTMKSLAQTRGARIRQGEARRITLNDHPQVTTSENETIECKKLVVTVGSWTDRFVRDGLPHITPTRQQLVYFKPKGEILQFRPGCFPVFFSDEHYGLPAAGIDAVKVSPKELTEMVDPDTADRFVDDEQILKCREACEKFVPRIADGDVVRTKVCLYDMTENSDFVIDEDPTRSDVIFGFGFSGHGFKFAPLIGELLAELALGEKPRFDVARFSAVTSRRRKMTSGAQLGKGE